MKHEHAKDVVSLQMQGLEHSIRKNGEASRASTLLTQLSILGCSLLTIGCWLILTRWYLLSVHYVTPGFAFDKIPGHFSSPTLRYTAALFLLLSVLYLVNYRLIARLPRISESITLALFVLIGTAGVANIVMYPVAAVDIFYYLGQFKVAYHYHQNPYLVTFLPTFETDLLAQYGWPFRVPPAYGPAWLLSGALSTVPAGFDNLLKLLLAFKSFNLLLVLLCGLLIYRYYDDAKKGWLAAYAFVANPLVLFESVANAHNDILMTLLLLAAVAALRKRSVLALPLLIMAALVKVFAVVLVPLFVVVIFLQKWDSKKLLVTALLAFTTALVIIVPFWADGRMLEGMLRGMRFADNLQTASLYSLAKEYLVLRKVSGETVSLVRFLFGGLFVLAAAALIWRTRDVERAPAYILLLFFLLVGSLNPWYLVPAIGLLALRLDRSGVVYLFFASALGLVVYQVDVWARFNSGLPIFQRHLLGIFFLPLPILVFLGFELWRGKRLKTTGAYKAIN